MDLFPVHAHFPIADLPGAHRCSELRFGYCAARELPVLKWMDRFEWNSDREYFSDFLPAFARRFETGPVLLILILHLWRYPAFFHPILPLQQAELHLFLG